MPNLYKSIEIGVINILILLQKSLLCQIFTEDYAVAKRSETPSPPIIISQCDVLYVEGSWTLYKLLVTSV